MEVMLKADLSDGLKDDWEHIAKIIISYQEVGLR